LLTARELAAAFQLDFSPDDGGATLVAPPAKPQSVTKPAAESAVATVAPTPIRPRRSVGRVMMVLMLLALIGVTAVVWLHPPYQAKARELFSIGLDTLSSQFSSSTGSGVSDSAPGPASHDATAQKPGEALAAGNLDKTSDEPHTAPRVDQPTRVVTPTSPAGAVKTPTDAEEIRQFVRSLRSAGIDAETSGDYRKAIAQYEQIRKVPREYWPSDLDVRMEGAKLRLK
jgi:hypothetical protein